MKTEQLVDLDPLTGEPLIYEEFPEFDEDAEPSYISARESYESPKTDDPASSNEEAIKLAKRAEANCAELRVQPQILSSVAQVLRDSGFAGPTWTVLLIVLSLFSRHLSKPVSVVVRGESAAGKSHAIKRALEFVSADAFHALTSMSSKALFYDKTDLAHKFVVVYEAEGLKNEIVTQAMRTLLSEGRLDYQFTDFESKSAITVSREGPTGLLTSTAGTIDYELGTRVFSVPTDDSPDLTKAIMMAEALRAAGDVVGPDLESFVALDRWLSANRKPVLVPFAQDLAAKTDGRAVRMRRDFDAILQLTKTHALMHQASRRLDPDGRVVADVDDYEQVYDLVGALVAYQVGESVPPEIRETVDAVVDLSLPRSDEGVTEVKVASKLGIHRTTAGRRLRRAMSAGYVALASHGRTKSKTYVWAEGMPGDDNSVLPHPDQLR